MKVKLSPELAYTIGFWRKRKAYMGVGIVGPVELQELFTKEVLNKGLITPEKIIHEEKKVFFYHTAYRKFFNEIETDQLERFKYLNEYAANYLAGMFDSTGEVDEKGMLLIDKCNKHDEMLFLTLGFGGRMRNGVLVVGKPIAFLTFIQKYVKRYKDHKIFEYVEKNAKRKKRVVPS